MGTRRWHRKPVRAKAFEMTGHGFADVGERFLVRVAHRRAAGQIWDIDGIPPVFLALHDNRIGNGHGERIPRSCEWAGERHELRCLGIQATREVLKRGASELGARDLSTRDLSAPT